MTQPTITYYTRARFLKAAATSSSSAATSFAWRFFGTLLRRPRPISGAACSGGGEGLTAEDSGVDLSGDEELEESSVPDVVPVRAGWTRHFPHFTRQFVLNASFT